MTVTEAVRERILDLGAVTSIAGQRVYSLLFPQSVTLPAVRVQRIDEGETVHLRGAGAIVRARVQVDSIAGTLAAAYALDDAVHGDGAGSGLSGWQGDIGSPAFRVWAILPADVRDDYDADELKQFRVMRDYFVSFTAN